MEDLQEQIEALKLAIARIEESDRLQSALLRKMMIGGCALVLFAVSGGYLSSLSPGSREILERAAIAVLVGTGGLVVGLPAVSEDKK